MFKHCLQHNSTQYWERLLGDSGRDGEDWKVRRSSDDFQNFQSFQKLSLKFSKPLKILARRPPPGDPPALLVNIHMDWQTLTRNSFRSGRRLVLGSQPPSWGRPSNFQSWGKPKIATWRPLPLWVQRGQACASEPTRKRLGRAVSPQVLNRVSTSDVRRPGPRDQSYCSSLTRVTVFVI